MGHKKYFLIIVIFFLLYVFISYHVLERTQISRTRDEAWRIHKGLVYYNILTSNPQILEKRNVGTIFLLNRACHPPLFELTEAGTWILLDFVNKMDENLMILITNAFFLAILLISVYGIGSMLYSRNVGILAALLISFFPVTFGHTRVAMLDFPLMCMISFSFYALLKTNKFQSFWFSALCGIMLGLAQLIKETTIIFILAPLIYYFYKSYALYNKKRTMLNFSATLLLFIIVAGSVYLRPVNLHALKTYFGKSYYIDNNLDFLYYLKNFIMATGPLILIFSLPLFLSYLINFRKREKFFFFWFFIPLVLFSISANKSIRFLLPILPAFTLITSQELFSNSLFLKFKKKYAYILISFSALQYAVFNYGFLDKWYRFDYHNTLGLLSVQKDKYLPVSLKLLDVFKQERFDYRRRYKVLFLFNIGEIDGPLVYKTLLYNLPIIVDCPMQRDKADSPLPGTINWENLILDAGYVVDKTGGNMGVQGLRENIADKVRKGFEKYKNNFKIIAEIKSFDESYMRIYRKITDR